MNDSMSLGIHRLWKDSFVSSMLPRLPPSFHRNPNDPVTEKPVFKCLDVAGGTGDIALRILDRAKDKFACRDIEVEIVDLNEGMLNEGRKRVAKTMYYNSLCSFLAQLPTADRTIKLLKSSLLTVTLNTFLPTLPITPSTCTPLRLVFEIALPSLLSSAKLIVSLSPEARSVFWSLVRLPTLSSESKFVYVCWSRSVLMDL